MQVPLEISFRGVSDTDWIDAEIRKQVARLERFSEHIISCRTEVARENKHPRSGAPYRVRVEVSLPGKKHLVAHGEPAEEVHLGTAIRDAFQAIERQIKESEARRRSHDTKTHGADEAQALVVRMFAADGYGFIKSELGQEEYYFNRAAVVHGDFERLAIGTRVRFVASMGEMGPQASTLQIVGKPGARTGEGGDEPREDVSQGGRKS